MYPPYSGILGPALVRIGMLFHTFTKARFQVLIVRGWLVDSDASLPFCPDSPTNALWGTNLDCMVTSPVGRCYCLAENPD